MRVNYFCPGGVGGDSETVPALMASASCGSLGWGISRSFFTRCGQPPVLGATVWG